MKRRSFFGLAAGAAVAGPSVLRETAAQVLTPTGLGDLAGLVGGGGGQYAINETFDAKEADPVTHATTMLRNIVGITAEHRSRLKSGQHIALLDPDIASYRSISMSAKIDWQRERAVNALLSERRSFWQSILDGEHFDSKFPPIW